MEDRLKHASGPVRTQFRYIYLQINYNQKPSFKNLAIIFWSKT